MCQKPEVKALPLWQLQDENSRKLRTTLALLAEGWRLFKGSYGSQIFREIGSSLIIGSNTLLANLLEVSEYVNHRA